MPETMNAIEVEGGGNGKPGVLKLAQIARPEPGEGQILVRVRAAGLNRADLMQRQGGYPPPPGSPDTMGLELAGEVVTGAGRWKPGDQVCALVGGGGYAEYAVVDARHALPIPKGLDLVQAGSLPEAVMTVYTNVFEDGALKAGETFMVHGATSGIGVTAIQMAKAAGAKVVATARGASKAEAARALGADVAVDATVQDFAELAQQAGGVDVVLEMVGGDYLTKDLDALKPRGRIAFIAMLAGNTVVLPLSKVMAKRAIVTGSTLRGRDNAEKGRLAAEVEKVVWPWVEAGKVKAQVYRTFPLAEAEQAHELLASNSHFGKIMLTM